LDFIEVSSINEENNYKLGLHVDDLKLAGKCSKIIFELLKIIYKDNNYKCNEYLNLAIAPLC
jgi:hypothetical protein